MNAYRLPAVDAFGASRRYVLNVSGGRTSAYLLRQVLDAYGGDLPAHVVPVFANTGKEREETLQFLHRIEREWSVAVRWLEYRYRREAAGGIRDLKHTHTVVDFSSAARHGEPFEAMIDAKKMLPHVKARLCTSQLKVNPIKWYVERELGWHPDSWANVLGIRADEQRRIRVALMVECKVAYPLALAGVTIAEIERYWRTAPFDLGIRSDQGNCDLCFLKGRGKLLALIAEDPKRTEWWVEQEEKLRLLRGSKLDNPSVAQFSKRGSYRELRDMALSQYRLPLDDEPSLSCFCGD